jgi:uncharacterized membrane protein YfcA
VVLGVVPGLAVGIIIGTSGGGYLAHLLSEAALRAIFAAVLIVQGLRDIRKSLQIRAKLPAVT